MRLIDADALMKTLEKLWNIHDDQDFCNKDVWRELENAPTIEPERKKGKWEYPRKFGHTHLMGKCSVCGKYESAEWIVLDKPNFCPNCGAEVRGDR